MASERSKEFLKEVGYYNDKQPGLGARFAEEVEAAIARALVYPGRRVAGISEHQAGSRQSLSVFYRLQAEPRWHCRLCGRQLFTPTRVSRI